MVAAMLTHSAMAKPVCHGPPSCVATHATGPDDGQDQHRIEQRVGPVVAPERTSAAAGSKARNAPTFSTALSIART